MQTESRPGGPVAGCRETVVQAEHPPDVGSPYLDAFHDGAGFPKEVTMVGRSIDASTWPTARQLADTLAAWHETAGESPC